MSKELQKKLKDGQEMLNKLKQYKFSPRTKEEMKNDFAFIFNEENVEKTNNNQQNNIVEQANEIKEEPQKEE